jgi:hypothetical protein
MNDFTTTTIYERLYDYNNFNDILTTKTLCILLYNYSYNYNDILTTTTIYEWLYNYNNFNDILTTTTTFMTS